MVKPSRRNSLVLCILGLEPLFIPIDIHKIGTFFYLNLFKDNLLCIICTFSNAMQCKNLNNNFLLGNFRYTLGNIATII